MPIQTFSAKYFDSTSGKTVDAIIAVNALELKITLHDAYRQPRYVIWHWANIKDDGITKDGYQLTYPGYPEQKITVADFVFPDVATYYLKNGRKKRYSPALIISSILITIVAIICAVYFWLVPFIATRIADRVPISYEEQLGDQSYQAIMQQYKPQPQATKLLNEFFQTLKVTTPYNIRITVVKDSVANAFALPGGHIVVYDKLLRDMQHYEELAALLSHEFAHVQLKHTTRSIFRAVGSYAFISLLFGDMSGIGAVVVENANSLKGLQYSRSLEKEADLYGLQLLRQRQISPQGFIDLFKTLQQENALQPAEWLSSHPDLQKRSEYIRKATAGQQDTTANPALQQIWQQIRELQ